jgi:hypothetical protein
MPRMVASLVVELKIAAFEMSQDHVIKTYMPNKKQKHICLTNRKKARARGKLVKDSEKGA